MHQVVRSMFVCSSLAKRLLPLDAVLKQVDVQVTSINKQSCVVFSSWSLLSTNFNIYCTLNTQEILEMDVVNMFQPLNKGSEEKFILKLLKYRYRAIKIVLSVDAYFINDIR